jgi:hypothetical protein
MVVPYLTNQQMDPMTGFSQIVIILVQETRRAVNIETG